MRLLCGGCMATFRTRNARDAHFDLTGHRAPAHECPGACGAVSMNDRELWDHMLGCGRMKRTKVNGLPWQDVYFFCEYCEQLFCGTTAQDDHQCIGYSCDRCDSTFETLTALTCHLLPILTMEIQEEELREELYARVQERDRRGILKGIKNQYIVPERHIEKRIHFKDERYVCHLCQTVFPDKMGMKEHFWSHAHASHHYECLSCKAEFKALGNAIKHLEIESKFCLKKKPTSRL